MKIKVKFFMFGFLFAFFVGFLIVKATWLIDSVASWQLFTATKMNEITTRIWWIFFDSWTNVLQVSWWVKYWTTSVPCNSTNKWVVKLSWDSFYGCNWSTWIAVILFIPKKNCLERKNAWSTVSWTYSIDPDWNWWNAAFDVYCDMTTDWWGWTLVARAISSDYNHVSASAVWTLSSPTQSTSAKLSDIVINSITDSSSIMRVQPDWAKFFIKKSLLPNWVFDLWFETSRSNYWNWWSANVSGARDLYMHDHNTCWWDCWKYITWTTWRPAYNYILNRSNRRTWMRNWWSVNWTARVR